MKTIVCIAHWFTFDDVTEVTKTFLFWSWKKKVVKTDNYLEFYEKEVPQVDATAKKFRIPGLKERFYIEDRICRDNGDLEIKLDALGSFINHSIRWQYTDHETLLENEKHLLAAGFVKVSNRYERLLEEIAARPKLP